MRKIILILGFSLISSTALAKEIQATVVFENLTNKEFTSGTFTIAELNKKIEVDKLENFKITLPAKGKYQFVFMAEDFNIKMLYPSRITQRNNTIIIHLLEKTKTNIKELYALSMASNLTLSDEQIEERIAKGNLNFIIPGIDSSMPQDYIKFKEKYGVGLLKGTCAIDPIFYRNSVANNQMISNYLNKKYGTKWLSELKSKPLGIK
ncbi:FEKKY domain-containing protein [Gaetbulibacter aestuarii]|uniref:DUF4369 domain-containing protein n=1 Tax=Gaetbulibacter aestuarii TaxID=1502358 RepID=A0ABW7MVF7_9FLAO